MLDNSLVVCMCVSIMILCVFGGGGEGLEAT